MKCQHMQQVERWATFVKNRPKKWKKLHTDFINSQFHKHQSFIKRLLQQPDGFDKIIELYEIKNILDYRRILRVK